MKKSIIIAVVLLMLIGLTPVYAISAEGPAESPSEDVYRELCLKLISPYVDKAVNNYYDEYLTYLPREDTWDYRVLSLETPHPGYYYYTVKLEVLPYVGPHLTVGRDHITLKIDNRGAVEIVLFEHLESHELPPYYENIIKKKLPYT